MIKSKLQKWIDEQISGAAMLWSGAFGNQVSFARDKLARLASAGLTYEESVLVPDVIGTHRSKSITLPVYAFNRPDLGLRMIARDNFHNWKLSVISERPILANFDGLFHTTPPIDPKYTGNPLAPVYFEGFPENLVFGYFSQNPKQWSAEIHSDEAMWTTMFLIMRHLNAVRPFTWAQEKK